MRRLFLLPAILAACSSPEINVKERWTASISNYSFIPLYPMREDVYVGDVRIHRLSANQGHGLYSRYLTHIDVGHHDKERSRPAYPATAKKLPTTKEGVTSWEQATAKDTLQHRSDPSRLRLMGLPKIEATRVTEADARGSFLLGKAWNLLLDGSIRSQENLLVSLIGIETAEISDAEAALKFKNEITTKLRDDTAFLTGVCVAAIAMNDADFKDTAISMVTRVAYARGIEYKYGDSFNASLRATATPVSGTGDREGGATRTSEDTVSQNEIFDRPMAFGVDAIMLDPKKLLANHKKACGNVTQGFTNSPEIAALLTATEQKKRTE